MERIVTLLAEHPELAAAIVAGLLGSGGAGALLNAWLSRPKIGAEAGQIDAQADRTRFETELAAIKALKEQMEWQQGENARLRCEVDALKTQYQGLESDFASLKRERDEYLKDRERLEQENTRLTREKDALARTVQQLRRDNTALRSRVKALERKVAEMEEQLRHGGREE